MRQQNTYEGIFKSKFQTLDRYNSVDGFGVGLTLSYKYKKDGQLFTNKEDIVDVLSPYFITTPLALIKENLPCEKTDKVSSEIIPYLKYSNAEQIQIESCQIIPVKLEFRLLTYSVNTFFAESNNFNLFLSDYQKDIIVFVQQPINSVYSKYRHIKQAQHSQELYPYFPWGYLFNVATEPTNIDFKHIRRTSIATEFEKDRNSNVVTSHPERDQLERELGFTYLSDPKKFLRRALIHRLDQVLGKDGYYFLFIVMDESCQTQLKTGQSVGQQWIELAKEMGAANASLSPLCNFQNSAEKVFTEMAEKTNKIAASKILLPKNADFKITAIKQIELSRAVGESKEVKKQILDKNNYQYNSSTNTIDILKEGIVAIGDQLDIEY